MNQKEQRIKDLQAAIERKFEWLETVEARGVLETNKQARIEYEKEKENMRRLIDALEVLTLEKTQKRELDNMTELKMEKRSNSDIEFAAMLKGTETRALQLTTDGAPLIPEQTAQEIIKKMEETSPVFKMVRKFNSVSGTLKIPKENTLSDAGFVGEGTNIAEIAIDLGDVKLTQKRVGAALSLSNQLIHESESDVVAYAKDLLSRRVAKAVEKSILKGSAAEEFAGIKGTAGIAEVKFEDGVVTADVLVEMHLALNPAFLQAASYIMSRTFFNKVAKLKDANGHYYLQGGVVNGKFQYNLFGFEVHVSDALDAGTVVGEVPVIFGNFEEGYGMMVRKDMSLTEVSQDTTQALRGSKLVILDGYMDGAVCNEQALVKGKVANDQA